MDKICPDITDNIRLYYGKISELRVETFCDLIRRSREVIGVDNTTGDYILKYKNIKFKRYGEKNE